MKITLDGKDVADTKYAREKILLDTNLLVFAHNRGSQHYQKASCILVASLEDALNAYVSSQNLLEFYSVMTNPSKIKPTPSPRDILGICSDLLFSRKIRKIFPHEDAAKEAIEIAGKKTIRGPQIFDCLLAVTARHNHIDRIWTDNVSDLRHFEEFVPVENPLAMEWELVAEKQENSDPDSSSDGAKVAKSTAGWSKWISSDYARRKLGLPMGH